MPIGHKLEFYRQMFKSTNEVGAFSASSMALANAIADPIERQGEEPLRILEVGSGVGSLTRAVIKRLRAGDEMHLVEINPAFKPALEALPFPEGVKVTIHTTDVEEIAFEGQFDVVVSSLPLLNFDPDKVERIFALYFKLLKPGGLISYWDSFAKGLGRLVRLKERHRMTEVLERTQKIHAQHPYRRRLVALNLPPAVVHVLQPAAAG